MYIEKVPNRNSPPAVLRPDSYREGDQVKKRTLANLSKLPDDIIDNLKLAEVEAIQLGLFDQVNLVEFESEDYPDERLIACRNPLIAQKNQQQREALLEATEKELYLIVQATQREKRALKGQDKIALRVGKVINQFKVNKYQKR